jgi:hypothetical protein
MTVYFCVDPSPSKPAEWGAVRQVDRGEGQRGPRGGLLLQVLQLYCRGHI